MTPERERVLRAVAERIEPGMRVGVDGISAAGKTTFADELAQLVDAPVMRVSFDDFHRPRAERRRYPEDAFDAARFRSEVLDAWRSGRVRTRIFDHVHDLPVDEPPQAVQPGSVLLVDGICLHTPELRDGFDLTVWLAADRAVALERAIARDSAWTENARERYATRYVPGETRYLDAVGPERLADLLVDNTDPARPRLVIHSDP